MNDKAHGGHSKIKWGAIIAGAAIVAGAVLFAPGVMTSIGDMLGGIANLFTPSAESMSETAKLLLTRLGGATLIGGGLAYFMSGKKEDHTPHHHDDNSFRARLEMDRMNNLMVMRAAYAGNPQAQAMLAQGQGR